MGKGSVLPQVPTMQRFQVACREAGAVSELVIYAGQAHGAGAFFRATCELIVCQDRLWTHMKTSSANELSCAGFFNGPRRGGGDDEGGHGDFNEFFFLALAAADLFLQERGWLSAEDVPDARAFFGAV